VVLVLPVKAITAQRPPTAETIPAVRVVARAQMAPQTQATHRGVLVVQEPQTQSKLDRLSLMEVVVALVSAAYSVVAQRLALVAQVAVARGPQTTRRRPQGQPILAVVVVAVARHPVTVANQARVVAVS
jgi:hypothetical protein